MTGRDVHSPANMISAQYVCIGGFYQGTNQDIADAYGNETSATLDQLDTSTYHGNYARNKSCDHCGARFAHGVVFKHQPTGDLIAVGHICANDHFGAGDWQRLRQRYEREAARARKAKARNRRVLAAAEAFLAAHNGLAAALETDHHITRDLKAKLFQWGGLSSRQLDLAHKLAKEAARPAKVEHYCAAPKGRQAIEGLVLSCKDRQSDWGWSTKLLLLVGDPSTPPGAFKVWVTKPRQLRTAHVERGVRIRMTCTITPTDRDPTFAIGKRPTNASVLTTDDSSARTAA